MYIIIYYYVLYISVDFCTFFEGIEMKTALSVVKMKMEPIYGDDALREPTVAVSTVCAKCECAIADRYIMRVSGRSYHERCLKCTACASKLDRSCFVWNAKLYCRQDYDK